jgi:hypothetical protein
MLCCVYFTKERKGREYGEDPILPAPPPYSMCLSFPFAHVHEATRFRPVNRGPKGNSWGGKFQKPGLLGRISRRRSPHPPGVPTRPQVPQVLRQGTPSISPSMILFSRTAETERTNSSGPTVMSSAPGPDRIFSPENLREPILAAAGQIRRNTAFPALKYVMDPIGSSGASYP